MRSNSGAIVRYAHMCISNGSVADCDVDAWLSLVERCVRDAEAAGSNPVASIQ